MEIKNKLTVTGERRGSHQGTCIKGRDKDDGRGVEIECGRWGWVGGRVLENGDNYN